VVEEVNLIPDPLTPSSLDSSVTLNKEELERPGGWPALGNPSPIRGKIDKKIRA